MMACGGGEGEELVDRGDNHATQEENKTLTKATPQSLGEQQGMDEMTTNATLPSLNEQGGSNAQQRRPFPRPSANEGGPMQ
jgi:hypothetical protein